MDTIEIKDTDGRIRRLIDAVRQLMPEHQESDNRIVRMALMQAIIAMTYDPDEDGPTLADWEKTCKEMGWKTERHISPSPQLQELFSQYMEKDLQGRPVCN
ncbi:hypothetical protein HMI48_00720 [Acidithiobacillus ferrooxidans]|uniref:hypothetical protein n=1 Tax=Acidithiobacillus ferrooxidans TaxID=920 RepID=UPI001C079300|nr:hypothetical protein [Acidithiobacillus ferrooxidans]MBU2772484.1 hypothetical protein [Acidithiobacillus ferrooxidans]